MKLLAIITVIVFATLAHQTSALCNTCSGLTGLACVDKDAFKVCTDGIPTSPTIKCPDGFSCTPNAMVCDPKPTELSCTKCNSCEDRNQVFACTGYNTFSLCLGTETPDTKNYTCPGDLVCSLESITICVNANTTGFGATCPGTGIETGSGSTNSTDPESPPEDVTVTEPTTVATTPNGLREPDALCKTIAFPGRYEVSADPTCTKYISCVSTSSGISGSLFECPKATFFNSKTQMCGAQKPERCGL